MTYVEFFDKPPSENICACLTGTPDRVIFLGDNRKQMLKNIENYSRIFEERGYNIEFLFKTVTKSNLDLAVSTISEIVETFEDCVFDITGGEEILLLALGIVCERYKDKNIQIHRINLRNGTVNDCDKDGNTIYKTPIALSVEENVRIFGGDVVCGEVDDEHTYKWDLTPDFLKDVELIWGICKQDVRAWNTQLGVFMAIEKCGSTSEDGLTTVVSREAIEDWLRKHDGVVVRKPEIINALITSGLLSTYNDKDRNTITISYKNKQVKKCLSKAGQALEMKIFVTAKGLLDEDDKPVYNDVVNGVEIDWDGKLRDDSDRQAFNTENEIDVMMMRGVVPVFVSCKNGHIDVEELYKLNTVAERFGGEYAKKVLVSNAIDSMGLKGKQFAQRAADMGIKIIKNVQDLSDAELAKELKNL